MTEMLTERRGSDFAVLARSIKELGLLDRRYGYYATRIGLTALSLAALAVGFVWVGDSWWSLFLAVAASFVTTQFAFLGHDAGHRQIFTSKRRNDWVGYGCGAVTGISYQWWVGKHNRHHQNPNHEDEDPDIDIPALAFSRDQARTKSGPLRWIAAYQAYLFIPLLMTQAVMLKSAGLEAAVEGSIKGLKREVALLATHVAWYLAAVFLVLSPGKAVLFILIHQGLMGIHLGMSFAPNHKGMPIIPQGEKLDFLRKQVLTSRNILGRRWVDIILGGLNYQIEHHLFPSMPSVSLRHAQPVVQRFCEGRGVSYTHTDFMTSYGDVLRHLHDAGAPLREKVKTA
ncbi:Fatty acid desaturase [Alloactinosynnema sp. L-07]|uniref:fatty acid desaturase family protein n=1 Tax=Alloactinosynnema sp. L-07 TaxID=1653480 RepID=UPI00065F0720|nr:acyl-CoA desaturase [Alloactinosynnema sp. L-07]CRK55984.1 Fatty acid desaturase [Alloactinosynnema sp. L-07]